MPANTDDGAGRSSRSYLSEDLDEPLLMLGPYLQVLLPPLLRVDEEEAFALRLARPLERDLGGDHVVGQSAAAAAAAAAGQTRHQLQTDVHHADRDLVL